MGVHGINRQMRERLIERFIKLKQFVNLHSVQFIEMILLNIYSFEMHKNTFNYIYKYTGCSQVCNLNT